MQDVTEIRKEGRIKLDGYIWSDGSICRYWRSPTPLLRNNRLSKPNVDSAVTQTTTRKGLYVCLFDLVTTRGQKKLSSRCGMDPGWDDSFIWAWEGVKIVPWF